MPLPASGAIRLGADVNVELGFSATAQIALGQASVRSLFAVPTGAIRLAADSRGKSAIPPEFTFTISSNQTDANLRTLAVNAGWDQSSKVIATVGSNVYVYSTSTATPGLTINGSWPGGVELVNNGFIIGMGGAGGANTNGANGGPAISLGVNVSIRNNSYIAGGGGGGGGNGGGGGGGAGGGAGGGGENNPNTGGAGGNPGSAGANGSATQQGANGGGGGGAGGGGGGFTFTGQPPAFGGQGGGGGRVLPGTGGSAGSGGTQQGSAGGSNNSAGSGGASNGGAGGGGWGASGGTQSTNSRAGGAGGKAVNLNGFSVTWLANGTRWGAIS